MIIIIICYNTVEENRIQSFNYDDEEDSGGLDRVEDSKITSSEDTPTGTTFKQNSVEGGLLDADDLSNSNTTTTTTTTSTSINSTSNNDLCNLYNNREVKYNNLFGYKKISDFAELGDFITCGKCKVQFPATQHNLYIEHKRDDVCKLESKIITFEGNVLINN